MKIGNVIRALREQQGLTLEALAYDAGMSGGNISRIERGIIDPPVGSLLKLCAALKIPPSEVFLALEAAPKASASLREEHQHYGHQSQQLQLIFATMSSSQRKSALEILQTLQKQK
jgi:transcriptional regulator with XRE-family HTH domain